MALREPGTTSAGVSVILYELNEVPWRVIDWYVERKPDSALAGLLRSAKCLTTQVPGDPDQELQPWRTWPTAHTSTPVEVHNSWELGQDPRTFRGTPLWDVADRAGLRVGLFGPMQTYPPRELSSGGFWVPDTFAAGPETVPASLSRFQALNLALTQDNLFSAGAKLTKPQLLLGAAAFVRLGLRPSSARDMAAQLLAERREPRLRGRRPALQVLPSFDVFWRQFRTTRPRLGVFFTNHVASMMHRFWGDSIPEYSQEFDYEADPIFSTFLEFAMDLADRQIARIQRFRASHPDVALIVMSGMGQGALEPGEFNTFFVLDDHQALLRGVNAAPAEFTMAMYPHYSLTFRTPEEPEAFQTSLDSMRHAEYGRVFGEFVREGCSLSFVVSRDGVGYGESAVIEGIDAQGDPVTTTMRTLGFRLAERVGGSNSGRHVVDGMLIAAAPNLAPDPTRQTVGLLDVAPSILRDLLHVDPSGDMQGHPGLFAAASAVGAST